MNRAERRRRTQTRVLAQLRIAQQGLKDPLMLLQPGRLKKRRALDCGRPRCALCGNPRRQPDAEQTVQELRQRREHFEGLNILATGRGHADDSDENASKVDGGVHSPRDALGAR